MGMERYIEELNAEITKWQRIAVRREAETVELHAALAKAKSIKTFGADWRECREAAAAELERYASSPENPRIERDFARSFAAAIRKLEPEEPTP